MRDLYASAYFCLSISIDRYISRKVMRDIIRQAIKRKIVRLEDSLYCAASGEL